MLKKIFVAITVLLILSTFTSFIDQEKVLGEPMVVELKWRYQTESWIYSSPAVADLDGDV